MTDPREVAADMLMQRLLTGPDHARVAQAQALLRGEALAEFDPTSVAPHPADFEPCESPCREPECPCRYKSE